MQFVKAIYKLHKACNVLFDFLLLRYRRHSLRCSARYCWDGQRFCSDGGMMRRQWRFEKFVQLHQIAGDVDERRNDHAPMHQVQHHQQQERLVRGLALGASVQVGSGARLREVKCLMVGVRSSMVFQNIRPIRQPWQQRVFSPSRAVFSAGLQSPARGIRAANQGNPFAAENP